VGGRIGDVPKHNFTGRVSYKIPQTHWTLRGGVGRSTERALVNASTIDLAGYTLADASVSYEQANWSVNIFSANITDEKYFSASGNANNVLPGDPRTFGVRITTKL
jgi:outer membrane receptor protein involved in Fe transport